MSSPAGSGAEPRRKTNLVHSKRHRTLLVARYRKYYEKCKIIIIFNSLLIFRKKPFLVFLVAFASIRFIWFKLSWRHLLFIVTYSYVGIARNWSHKRRTSPQGPKIVAESRKQRWTSGEACRWGTARKQTVFGHENPLKMHTLCINFISFTAEMRCIC